MPALMGREYGLILAALKHCDNHEWLDAGACWWAISKLLRAHDPYRLLYLAEAAARYCDALAARVDVAA